MTENLGDQIARLHNLRQMLEETKQAVGMLTLEVIQQMDAAGMSLYEDTRFKVRIPVNRKIDPHKFVAVFGEVLEPAIFDSMVSPAHTKEVEVPLSVNGVKAKKLIDMGWAPQFEETLLPNKRSLRIEERKEERAM